MKSLKTNLEVLKVLQGFAVGVQGRGFKVVEFVAESADKTCYWNKETRPCGKRKKAETKRDSNGYYTVI